MLFLRMLSEHVSALYFVAILLLILLYSSINKGRCRRAVLPPGPKGWPFIGNMFDIPAKEAWLAYEAMGEMYGETEVHFLFFYLADQR